MSYKIFATEDTEEEGWISVSDLMAGLMIVFLFILITYIHSIVKEQESLSSSICKDLQEAFEDAFYRDGISICKDGVLIRFHDPDTLFDTGEHKLQNKFKNILDHFFPRYLNVLVDYKDDIEEIRIEGHTDDTWKSSNDPFEIYLYNIDLSQKRTWNVLKFLFDLDSVDKHQAWLTKRMTANGLSSSQLIYKNPNEVDRETSKRVEFKLRFKDIKPSRQDGDNLIKLLIERRQQ